MAQSVAFVITSSINPFKGLSPHPPTPTCEFRFECFFEEEFLLGRIIFTQIFPQRENKTKIILKKTISGELTQM